MQLAFSDNIVAEMTPSGRAAVSGIRISGPEAKLIVERVFAVKLNKPRFAYHCSHYIDDLIITYYKSPNSYTGQDICEIFCHGNPGIVDSIINSIIDVKEYSVRSALPGEFTKRAYLNDKMDLLQAESIMDIINSSTKKAAELRGRTLRGELSETLMGIRQGLLDLAVKAELEIDFEEDKAGIFNYGSALSEVNQIQHKTQRLICSFKSIEKLSRDIKVLITGPANVGKSSLFNRILDYERSIVHHLPGTTRDYIEAEVLLGDFEVIFIDTAGLRDVYDNEIEKNGADRINRLVNEAFLIIEVGDGDHKTNPHNDDRYIFVRNKIDLDKDIKKDKNIIYTSSYTGEGVAALKMEIERRIREYMNITNNSEDIFLFNKRQIELVSKMHNELEALILAIKRQDNIDIVSFLIRRIISIIDELLGREHVSEEVLDELFSKFCIGK